MAAGSRQSLRDADVGGLTLSSNRRVFNCLLPSAYCPLHFRGGR
jgi:hypothetical protein